MAKTLTDEQFQTLGISLADLDLTTGSTSTSVTRYFMPSEGDPTGISGNDTDSVNDAFTDYSKSRGKRLHGDVGWPEYLADAFYVYARNQNGTVFGPQWEQLILNSSKRGLQYRIEHRLSVESGREYKGGYSSHRIVFAVMDIKTDERRPSVGELAVLVSWMLAGMRHQESTKLKSHKKDGKTRFHMVFPTLVYCFMRPARARVLYGYFENDLLKVITTKAHDFNVANYAEMMGYLVRWASPRIHGDTTVTGEPLNYIEEEANSET